MSQRQNLKLRGRVTALNKSLIKNYQKNWLRNKLISSREKINLID